MLHWALAYKWGPQIAGLAVGFGAILSGADIAAITTASVSAAAVVLGKIAEARSKRNETAAARADAERDRDRKRIDELTVRIQELEVAHDDARLKTVDALIWAKQLRSEIVDYGLEPMATAPGWVDL